MNSRAHGSEEELARRGCALLEGVSAPQVLIGGLGMGFTAAAALRQLPVCAELVIAELVPGLVEWNRHWLGHLAGYPLTDCRVRIEVGDVARLIEASRANFDLILLDVDNGPNGLTRAENDRLYSIAGVKSAFRALRPGGVFGVWSVAPDQRFSRNLQAAGFRAEEVRVRARNKKKGARHCLWLARC